MKHIFIINPTSGHGSARSAIPFIDEICTSKKLNYEKILTEYPGHASEIASSFSIKDNVCLYTVGGDGTAYEILNGINDKVCMAIIPCGTGNDFYRMVASQSKSIRQRILDTIEGKIVDIDYGVSNRSRFLNCTTIGFDAEINHMVTNTLKKTILPSSLMYPVAVATSIFKPSCQRIKIEIDGIPMEREVLLLAIMNGRYYGGGFTPTPQAEIQDGLFDICIVEPMKRTKILNLLPKYMKGTHTHLKEVTMLRGRHIVLSAEKQMVIQSDGEDFQDQRITFDLMKKGMRFKVPQSSSLQ